MQKLSKRLQAVADFVTPGSRTADIGTDHGFLPIYLIQSGRCPQVIAMDIRKGPLLRAQEHIAAAGLTAAIQTRLSDGMQKLAQGEADSAVIAGMGGQTVIRILKEASHLLESFKELVVEPQSDLAKVRAYVREHKMYIDQEDLVYEAGKFYPVLHIVSKEPVMGDAWEKNRQTMDRLLQERLTEPQRIRALLDRYGACTVYGMHPMLGEMLAREHQREQSILCELEKGAADAGEALERKKEVRMRLEEIGFLQEIINDAGKLYR